MLVLFNFYLVYLYNFNNERGDNLKYINEYINSNDRNAYWIKNYDNIKNDYYKTTNKYGPNIRKLVSNFRMNILSEEERDNFKNYMLFVKNNINDNNKFKYIRQGETIKDKYGNDKLKNDNVLIFIREEECFNKNIKDNFNNSKQSSKEDIYVQQDYLINNNKNITGDFKLHITHWPFEQYNEKRWLEFTPISKKDYNSYCDYLDSGKSNHIYLFNELVLFYGNQIFYKYGIIDFNKVRINMFSLDDNFKEENNIYSIPHYIYVNKKIYGVQLDDIRKEILK